MRRLFRPLVLVVSAMVGLSCAYVVARLGSGVIDRTALAVPFVLVWAVPVFYWGGVRRAETLVDRAVVQASYLSMAWASFLTMATLARDAVLLATMWLPALAHAHEIVRDEGVPAVLAASLLALLIGVFRAVRGPRVRRVDIPIDGLHEDLAGFTIAQISDLHVGRTIRAAYVQKVTALTHSLGADLVALTGDIVDGPVERLAPDVAPLRALAANGCGFFVLGNHDCYAGPRAWAAHFRELGFEVLLNGHVCITHKRARIVIGGVLDPALRPGPQADAAIANAPPAEFRLLLAHNPTVAPDAERAGFDLQLSGHTHGGQFFPWTLVVRRVHAPHYEGVSKEGRMWVYVSPGTGWWGPPVRLGTRPEVALIRLVRARDSGDSARRRDSRTSPS